MVDKMDMLESYEENIYWLTHQINAWKNFLKNTDVSFDKFKKECKDDFGIDCCIFEIDEKGKDGENYFINIYQDFTKRAIVDEIKNQLWNLEEYKIEEENHLYFAVRFYDEFDNMMNQFMNNHKENEYNANYFLHDYFEDLL